MNRPGVSRLYAKLTNYLSVCISIYLFGTQIIKISIFKSQGKKYLQGFSPTNHELYRLTYKKQSQLFHAKPMH